MSRTSALASAHACGAVVVQNGACHRFSLQFRHSGSIPPISTCDVPRGPRGLQGTLLSRPRESSFSNLHAHAERMGLVSAIIVLKHATVTIEVPEAEHPGCISARLDSRTWGGWRQCPRG